MKMFNIWYRKYVCNVYLIEADTRKGMFILRTSADFQGLYKHLNYFLFSFQVCTCFVDIYAVNYMTWFVKYDRWYILVHKTRFCHLYPQEGYFSVSHIIWYLHDFPVLNLATKIWLLLYYIFIPDSKNIQIIQ